jgi:hypothetical protein
MPLSEDVRRLETEIARLSSAQAETNARLAALIETVGGMKALEQDRYNRTQVDLKGIAGMARSIGEESEKARIELAQRINAIEDRPGKEAKKTWDLIKGTAIGAAITAAAAWLLSFFRGGSGG